MAEQVRIELLPLGRVVSVARGTPLRDVLFAQGVEFPCGGRARCKGCRIKVLAGSLPATQADEQWLSPAELATGWRLACQASADQDLKIELAQWEAAILTDNSTVAFSPRAGLGAAVDLGTTTVVAQLLDLRTGQVLGVRLGLNAQAKHGADVMSRIEFALGGGQPRLEALIRRQIGNMLDALLATVPARAAELSDVVIVGNSVMHHLFCGLSVEPLSHSPFEPRDPGLQQFTAEALGWRLPGQPVVRFLPCLGSFVGSDILAGILATRLHESTELAALIDLGTNGELVVGTRERLLCASTAAGPAFEGARIAMGMRAATGAIAEVQRQDGQLRCGVLGHGPPRGICGSGLVDAVAAALDLGWINAQGRLVGREALELAAPVVLKPNDIRELQLAKGAIAAGLRILTQQWGVGLGEIAQIYLAGAFGNYISRASARRIGLLPFPPERVTPVGNSALHGAKIALFNLPKDRGAYPEILARVRHVSLNEDPQFMDTFVDELAFPTGVEREERGA